MKNPVYIWGLLLALTLVACKSGPSSKDSPFFLSFIPADNPFLQYQGRIAQDSAAHILHWSGASVKLGFYGNGMKGWLKDEKHDNYYNILVDGRFHHILRPDTVKTLYTLVEGLPEGDHTLEIFKRTEWTAGKTWFYGFEPLGGEVMRSLPPKKRRIEFYGNSITAAYAVEDSTGGDSPDSTYTNFYLSYAAITARKFDANYSAIVKSGIGITVSWSDDIMPEIWNRLDPTDPLSRWEFSNNQQPDVVVVNLLQNDSWLTLMPKNPQYQKRFTQGAPSIEYVTARYQDFVRNLRNTYPAAHIICLLGNMDITKKGSPWPKYVKEVVSALKDSKIYTLTAPHKDTGGHPRIAEQQAIAEPLIQLISQKTGWK